MTKRDQSLPPAEKARRAHRRLIVKFSVGDECWLWNRPLTNGYGRHGQRGAHRVVYELLVGPIPAGLQLDHLCRVRHCVRPDHLEPVTQAENIRRGEGGSNTRSKTHCPTGHPYDETNTRTYRGRRYCRACHLLRSRSRTEPQL